MEKRPWKRERIIELPYTRRYVTEPLLQVTRGRYCGTCGTLHTTKDTFCGQCGTLLQHDHSNEYATLSFRLTGASRL